MSTQAVCAVQAPPLSSATSVGAVGAASGALMKLPLPFGPVTALLRSRIVLPTVLVVPEAAYMPPLPAPAPPLPPKDDAKARLEAMVSLIKEVVPPST